MKQTTATLLAVCTGTFVATFDGAAVQMALPVISRELHAQVHASQWVMTAFLLVTTAALLPAGRMGDMLGRNRSWRLGLLLFGLASAACTVVPGLWWLVGARSVQGLAAALITANAAPILVDAFPKSRGRALGIGNVAIALGLVMGPPVGALLTQVVSWRLIFVVAVPTTLTAWWLTRTVLPHSPHVRERIDYWGGVLAAVALTGLLVCGTFGRRWGWVSVPTFLFAGIGVAALVAFVALERRERQPLLDVRFFGQRMFASGALASMFGFASLFTLTVAMPFFLVVAQKRSLVEAGLLVGVVPVMLSLVAPLAGLSFDKIGSRALTTPGLLAVAAALAILSTAQRHTGAGLLMLAMGLAGAGLGLFEAPNDADVLGSLPERRLGVGTATLGTMRNLGMTLGVAVAATLYDYGVDHGGPVEGVQLALIVGAGLAGAGTIAAAVRPSRRVRQRAKGYAPS